MNAGLKTAITEIRRFPREANRVCLISVIKQRVLARVIEYSVPVIKDKIILHKIQVIDTSVAGGH